MAEEGTNTSRHRGHVSRALLAAAMGLSVTSSPALPTGTATAERLFAQAEAAGTQFSRERSAQMIAVYDRACSMWRARGDSSRLSLCALRIGGLHQTLGEPDQALASFDSAVRAAQTASDADTQCAALSASAKVLLDVGRMNEARERAAAALELSRRAGLRSREAEALDVTADIGMFSGQTRASLDLLREALAISRELGDRRAQARELLNLGYAHADLSEPDEAQQSYEGALALWREVGDRRGQASSLIGLGNLHHSLGERQLALERYRNAKSLLDNLDDPVALAGWHSGIGIVQLRMGEAGAALINYKTSVELLKAAKVPAGEAANLLTLGVCLTSLGRHDEALRGYEEALAIATSTSDRRLEGRALEHIGRLYAVTGDVNRAIERYGASMTLAKTVGDRLGEIYARNGLGEVLHEQGVHAAAEEQFSAALGMAERIRNRAASSLALYNLARVQRSTGRIDTGLATIRRSLELVEGLRADVARLDLRASYLASVRDRYDLEIDLLMQLDARSPAKGYAVLAFDASERARARSLLDGLAEARAGIREGVEPGLLERERSVRRTLNAKAQRLARVTSDPTRQKELTALSSEIDQLTADYRDVEGQIRAASPRYAALTQLRPVTGSQARALVRDDGSVLVQYFLGSRRSYAWTVTPRAITAHVLPGRAEIEDLVRPYLDTLSRNNTGAATRATGGVGPRKSGATGTSGSDLGASRAAEISALLLAPMRKQLENRRVMIVSDGILNLLPFAALPDPRPAATAGERAPLIARHELVYLPSASTLALLRGDWNREKRWPKNVMVVADPVFESDDPRLSGAAAAVHPSPVTRSNGPDEPADLGVARLLGSRREARSIASLAPSIDVALDFEANRDVATSPRLADYRIVHFATHGIVDNERPELSGIILSLYDRKGRGTDGFLRLHDIYNLKLPVDLVVLSACSTGLGKEVIGEGLIGLVRGFMYAGSRRVLATLWKVDDEATAELMTRFYRGMLEQGLSAPQALRAAQLDLAATTRWKDPFYWASFVLQGDAD